MRYTNFMQRITSLKLFSDGGARGNPGPAGYGFVVIGVSESGAEIILKKCGNYLGIATNNQAEYKGIISGLEWILDQEFTNKPIKIYLDSLLIVNQVNGKFKVKNAGLKPLWGRVVTLLNKFPKYSIQHVPRAQNAEADRLANLAMDEQGRVEQ